MLLNMVDDILAIRVVVFKTQAGEWGSDWAGMKCSLGRTL
jgi:hypothetical protein